MFRVDVVAAGDAHHRCPDLGGAEVTAEWQVAERPDVGGEGATKAGFGAEGEDVREVKGVGAVGEGLFEDPVLP
ncbi:hypothetical protein ABZY19_21395 [Streptomyces sp. NPDC006475]|uniref:hypothetical protein n=1 Tax=Streptomyces sp. NPDC006475 TaxID=3155719 RepID=UPI0033AA0E02